MGVSDPEGTALAQGLAERDERSAQALLDGYWDRGYRVALGLTGDPAKAEDAVQEAVVTAMRIANRFDPERGSFQSWFFKIVHNRARDQRRASARRRHYEEQAAMQRRETITQDLGDDDVGLVLRELGELEPKFRAAVTLRYVEGLSYREVGEALGWPEGTATSRARRGLKKLRARLRELEGVTPALLTPKALERLLEGPFETMPAPAAPSLASLTRPKAAPSVASPAATLSAPKLIAGLAALALLGWLLQALAGAGTGAPGAGGQQAQASPAPSAAASGGGAQAQDPGADVPTPGPAGGDGGASPADAESADPIDTGPASPRPGVTPREPSVARVLGRLGPGPLQGAWVAVLDRDYGQGGPLEDDGDAHGLGRALGGWGFARLARAEAVPETQDALSLGVCYPVGADGVIRLPLTKPERYLLAVGARGCANQTAVVEVRAEGVPEPLDLQLDWIGVAELQLTCVDAAGEPLAGAEVMLLARSEGIDAIPGRYTDVTRWTRTTDAHGRLALDLAPGLTFLRAGTGPLDSRTARLELRAGQNPALELPLLAASKGELVVSVVDGAGQPVPDAAVTVNKAQPELLMRPLPDLLDPALFRDRTDADGVFRFPDRAFGAYVVLARAGDLGGRSAMILVEAPGGAHEVTVVLDEPIATGHLRLRLLDPDGQPLTEGERYHEVQVSAWIDGVLANEQPDDEGGVLISDLPAGACTITLGAMAYPRGAGDPLELTSPQPHPHRVVRGETAELELQLARVEPLPSRHLATVLFDTGVEVDMTQVACSEPATGSVSEADGLGEEFILEGSTTDAALTVVAWTDVHFPVARVIPTDGGEHTVRLEDGPSWSFEVVDEAGEPLEGCELDATRLPWDTNFTSVVYETDEVGQLTLRGTPQALYVTHDDCRGTLWTPPAHGRAPAEPIRVVLHRRASGTAAAAVVRGVVLDARGWPAPGVKVSAYSATGDVDRATTDADGRFELPEAPSGELTVLCYRGDLGISVVGGLSVSPSEVLDDVEVHYGETVEVTGQVTGQARRAQRIRMTPLDPTLAEILSGELKFRTGGARELFLSRWPPGRWRFELLDSERAVLASQELELRAGEPAPALRFEVPAR